MDDFDTAYTNAHDERAFSNGTDWEIWSYNWCERDCIHDAAHQNDWTKAGCPLIMVAYLGRTPREWIPGPDEYCGDKYTCVYYRNKGDDDPDAKPEPLPDPPGMEALFPRELVEPGRVFIPLPEIRVGAR